MEIYQVKSREGNTYLIYRFFDNANNNFEYYIYKLVKSMPVAKEFGISENIQGRKSKLNTREMCDRLINKIQNGEV